MRCTIIAGVVAMAIGCSTPHPQPTGPSVTYTLADGNINNSKWLELGAWQWRKLCWNVLSIGDTGGDIHINIYREPYLGGPAGLAWLNSNTVIVGDWLRQEDLAAVIAHEFGHILLNTATHSEGWGVMSPASRTWQLTQDDIDFACNLDQCLQCEP